MRCHDEIARLDLILVDVERSMLPALLVELPQVGLGLVLVGLLEQWPDVDNLLNLIVR